MTWLNRISVLAANFILITQLVNCNLIPAHIVHHKYPASINYTNINSTSTEFFRVENFSNDNLVTDLQPFDDEIRLKEMFNFTSESDIDRHEKNGFDLDLPPWPEHDNIFHKRWKEMFLNFSFTKEFSNSTHWPSNTYEGIYSNNTFSKMNETNDQFENTTFTSEYDKRPAWQITLGRVVTYVVTFNAIGVMLGMGCTISWIEITKNLWPPIGIIIGMIGQFIVLPATGFGFSILFKLKPYEALGCLVVSCSPGGTFSNFFTYWVDGDIALSIAMTACSSVIALAGMPFNMWLYSSYYVGQESSNIVIPYLNIIKSLGFICGPVIVGMIIRHFSEKVATVITRVTSIVGYLLFLIAMTSWILIYWKIFVNATSLIYVCAIILPITGFTLAYIVAFILKRTHKVCRTIGIETGCQNMPVALSIILLSFSEPEIRATVLLFPTLYSVFMYSEVLIGVGFYKTIQWLRNKKKQERYPLNQKSIMKTNNDATLRNVTLNNET